MTVTWRGAELMAQLRAAGQRGLVAGAEKVLDAGNTKIRSGSKTGHLYVRRGVAHRASAPGESPASDTGGLVQSGVVTTNPATLTAGVRWATNYARALELGSNYTITGQFSATSALQIEMGSQKLEPRPFARPALYENVPLIEAAVAAEFSKILGPVGNAGPRIPVMSNQGELF